ncbi:MAG: hypothetical protein PHD37_00570 [Gallionellaceae bacterium]|nr:hypothetical protein [Gallionellaceae bacterium]
MSALLVGLLCWLGVAIVAGVVIGRFMRLPESNDPSEVAREITGLARLPGYGGEGGAGNTRAAEPIQAQSHSERNDALQ